MTPESRLPQDFIEKLPDPPGARRFIQQLSSLHPDIARRATARPPLLAELLVLAAHSPFLAETLLRRPERIEWLGGQRDLDRLKSKEELFEELARFAAIHSDLGQSEILSRFKQREWLRIYLRDCLNLATLSETTLELSNLADVLLQHALWHCSQQLINQYGRPQTADARGRIQPAAFTIVALGKLGSQELNYASDIDLLYLYSENGITSSGQLSNKDFFIKLAERITQVIDGVGEEGAVYRVDLRLRPHGRAGDIAVCLNNAIQYYRRVAQPWERQALIRARCSAGDASLAQQFFAAMRDNIYPPQPLPEMVEEIRQVKDQIDRETGGSERGIHVKLGKGGIRELEFIVQALQLYFGGREPWVRAGQILIGLQRLADKDIISDTDRAQLSEAYTFLRMIEHRLQMEHGLRTHVVPANPARLDLLARRLGYTASHRPGQTLSDDLRRYMAHVGAVFENLFRSQETGGVERLAPPRDDREWKRAQLDKTLDQLATAFGARAESPSRLSSLVPMALTQTLNPDRATKNLNAFAQSLTQALAEDQPAPAEIELPPDVFLDTVEKLIKFFGVSQFFSQILISHPTLVGRLARTAREFAMQTPQDYLQRLRTAVIDLPSDFPVRMDALRRRWHQELLQIGYLDITGVSTLQQTNLLQTALARASLTAACDLALEQLQAAWGSSVSDLRYVIFGLGRLGHNGIDYGSDLDLLVVYDDGGESPLSELSLKELAIKLIERVIHILSAVTREGYLYVADLRLRPDGQSGPLAHSRTAFLDYVSAKAETWEHLAYLKAYPVAGDPAFAQAVYQQLQARIFQAHASDDAQLARQVRRMRERIERDKAPSTAERNIKYAPGGMLDVYFTTRYLQLKHHISEPAERGTLQMIDHLHRRGVIDDPSYRTLFEGYAFLRRTDHCLRLLYDRPKDVLPANPENLRSLVNMMGVDSIEAFQAAYQHHTANIRRVYEHIVDPET